MSVRPFHICTMPYGDAGKRVSGVKLFCTRCTNTAERPRGSTKTMVDPRAEEKRFRHMFERIGWFVGKSPAFDLCPECIRRANDDARRRDTIKLVEPNHFNVSTTPVEERKDTMNTQPRIPSASDKRGIFAIIESNYENDKVGYKPGWTDQKIATDLGVPLAWVVDIRKEFFGAEGGNPEITKAIEDAKKYLNEAREIEAHIVRLKTDLNTALADYNKLAGRHSVLERNVAEIEKRTKA